MLTEMRMRKSSRPFSDAERGWLLELLDRYSATVDGKWLKDIEYHGCEYRWCDAMNLDNGVMGARPLFGECVYLAPYENGDILPEASVAGYRPSPPSPSTSLGTCGSSGCAGRRCGRC